MEEVDPDAIDRDGKIPPAVIQGLAELGAFGMKIPKEYGGLGFTQREYGEAMKLITEPRRQPRRRCSRRTSRSACRSR